MALLIGVHDIAKSFGAKTLFDGLSFGIEEKERIGLIGSNGAGKTTLLHILEGNMVPDAGTISYQRGIRMGILEQVPVLRDDATVQEVVLEGLAGHAASMDDWEMEILAEQYMARLALDPHAEIATLSGGWKKKVALARELVKQPDILFLDEPTNHLDVESILWLEKFLANAPFATLTVTHDRLFLQRVANRILELDRRNVGGLLSVRGSYADYLVVKEQAMHAQERHETVLRNALRRETEWLRRGPAARTTKQQARIDRAQDLKETVSELTSLNQVRVASMEFQGSALPKRLLEVKGIAKSYGPRTLFAKFHLRLSPGTRVGLLGMNGAGKSTLIRVLLGQEAPDTGEVFHAEQLAVAYFEQNRETLDPAARRARGTWGARGADPELSLARTVCPLGDHVDYRGQRVHIKSYLGRFLFTSLQMDLPVGKLSGGEQSRILIAKLMLQPANLLVLDEPTNDLDLATLNVLQDCLTEFEGAIILVTHDRYFLDQVANTIIAFPPPQSATPSHLVAFADLSQWETWFQQQSQPVVENSKPSPGVASAAPGKKKKFSYKEQREFDGMESTVQMAEAQLLALQKECELPTVASDAARLTQIAQEMAQLKTEIDRLYHRWAELEALTHL